MLNIRYLLEIYLGVTDLNSNEDLSVSVVVPFYNRSRFLKRLLDSVAAQTLAADKIYIIDNGSNLEETSSAWDIIKTHTISNRCVFTSSISKGNANFARNLGYELAKTKYVAFLDSDDWWEENHLHHSVICLKNSNKAAVYSIAFVHTKFGNNISRTADINDYDNPFSLILSPHGYIAQTSSYIIDKTKVYNNVLWDVQLKRHQDFDYFSSIFYKTSGWIYCPKVTTHIDWDTGGANKSDLDFISFINFYNKWKENIPNTIRKHYLKRMLYLAHQSNANKTIKSFYFSEIKRYKFFDDFIYKIKCSKPYVIPKIKFIDPSYNFTMLLLSEMGLKKPLKRISKVSKSVIKNTLS